MLLVRPFRELDKPGQLFDHLRIDPTTDAHLSNGAFRRWLDRAWKRLGLEQTQGGPLGSRWLIPRYVDPQVARAVHEAHKQDTADHKYNVDVDRKADERDQAQFDEEEHLDFRDEL